MVQVTEINVSNTLKHVHTYRHRPLYTTQVRQQLVPRGLSLPV